LLEELPLDTVPELRLDDDEPELRSLEDELLLEELPLDTVPELRLDDDEPELR
jgi:hypothetical protein